MTLSIVIVNYNVRHYLEQCLTSVFDAAEEIETEVFVVDNCSVDDSVQMVRERFPQARLIVNADNPGFARANNQALRQCQGDYVLLLNPDTIVERDTLRRCIDFIAATDRCGGVCVKMINGEGRYLKESKRGFPSPATSFYKISGLISLMPHSRKVAAYYMGHLPDDETNEVDIMPGAFIMLRRKVLQEVGLLDETYFMYGEDIDFSWRIHLAGYKNYYLPSARIIHYKGESTKKGNMNYVYAFYNAMSIFVKRYFSGGNARFYTLMLQLAIWLRGLLAVLGRAARRVAMPAADLMLSFCCFLAVKEFWAAYVTSNVNYYPDVYTWGILPVYALVLIMAAWLSGGYDRPVSLIRLVGGMGAGALTLLAFYSVLDESMRYSRAILLLGSSLSLLASLLLRLLLSRVGVEGYRLGQRRKGNFLIVGGKEQYERALRLFGTLGITPDKAERIDAGDDLPARLKQYAKKHRPSEIVFCNADVEVSEMIDSMVAAKDCKSLYRTLPSNSDVLIGGDCVYSIDELYARQQNTIATPRCQRSKRLFDIAFALLFMMLCPVLVWMQRKGLNYLADCWQVLCGRMSWVGYNDAIHSSVQGQPLPYLKPSVFATRHILPHVESPDTMRLDLNYAHDYSVATDFAIVMRNLTRL